MRPKTMGYCAALTAIAVTASLVLSAAAEARSGDWLSQQSKKSRWQQSQPVEPPKPKEEGD